MTEKNKLRTQEMWDLYTSTPKSTLEDIGKVYSLTRERVRQLFKKMYGEDFRLEMQKHRKAMRKEPVKKSCVLCGTDFIIKPIYPKKKYCSHACFSKVYRVNTYPEWVAGRSILKKNFTEAEWREINRLRAASYWKRNHAKRLKKCREWQRENKKKVAIYSKRWAERKKYGQPKTPLLVS